MTRNFGVLASALLTLSFLGFACASGEVVEGPASGTGNTTGQGTAGAGNTVGTAGTTGGGNNSGVGNNAGQGAGPGRGGTTGVGNTTGQAGSSGGVGNTTGRGGTTGTGNTVGSGGVGNTVGTGGVGNTTGTGGVGNTTGTGGSGTSSCPPTFDVSSNGFVQMPAKGGACWSGYPYTYQDTLGTMVMPMPMAAWTTSTLKMTGTLAAQSGTMYPYAGMGFSIGQTASGTAGLVTPTGTGLTFNFANSTTGAGVVLRAQVTNGTTTWCKDVTTSPVTISYSDFHVTCYNTPPGAAYAKEPIKGIELNLAAGTAQGTINLTITSVTEN